MTHSSTDHPRPSGLASRLVPAPRLKRLVWLMVGLVGFGYTLGLMVLADLGLSPWDVFHQGLAGTIGARLGLVLIAVSIGVLLLWIPLRQMPGVGTLANAVVVGIVLEATTEWMPEIDGIGWRVGALVVGIVGNGVATALYIGAGLGPGPRDGLMTGLAARGLPLGRVRTGIEITVLVAGWILGGTVGVGTVLYALAIGPIAQRFIPRFQITP